MSQPIPRSEDQTFSSLGLSPKLIERLNQLKFTTPTPIQRQSIPVAVTGKDIIGIAQTGTGKTLAFLLPTLQRISRTKQPALIVLPTRELASQVEESLRALGQKLGIRQALLICGGPMGKQIKQIQQKPHVYIGTPGRIIDHLEQKTLKLNNVGVLVLDEADRMLDMGFMPQINRILEQLPPDRQTFLFSATMPPEIVKIASRHMKTPVQVEIARAGTIADKVNQELFIIRKDQKNRLLDKLLTEYNGTVLVFSRTKYGAKRICRAVREMGHDAAEIHSNLSLAQRRRSLEGFKSGKYRVLVATDIAARGIDVNNIELVINYDLPENLDDYVHRVGRTGRAGKAGQAISFVMPDQKSKVRLIEKIVRTRLPISSTPALPPHRPTQHTEHDHRSQKQTRRFNRRAANGRSGRARNRSRATASPAGRRPRLHT